MFSGEFAAELTALVTVVLIDIVLAGDNAVVVGAAAAGLPAQQQRQVIWLGAGLALVARVAFALVATQLLDIIGLLLAGGLLLLWVGWKMWRELRAQSAAEKGELPSTLPGMADSKPIGTKTFASAVTQVAIADISMSLDNVLAVAGAARDHPWIMMFGLALSIALMAVAAGFIARIIDRHRWMAYVGLLVILWVALKMIWDGGQEVFVAVAAL
ncbi:YjbE family putative metal transport protein [Marinimicrococcus flavescens]|uniref:YjbE family putative metal transport protein n=1 Tax=Marinimicrococcus flavescens TaxID=3031815 RepID=A0AAP3XT25_9PROT|nr:YjbE family putative metal transport protein [Marinimicrococcus flavescens]MDF1587120.1 YjbE family putative metal transport protein [Marinimicrococcus flavescens]